jgi:hypothetical protein
MTGAELRVLEARMDNLNAMLQDLIHQIRRIQTPSGADHRQQVETDLCRWLVRGLPDTPGHLPVFELGRPCRWPGAVTSTIETRFQQPRGSAVPGLVRC